MMNAWCDSLRFGYRLSLELADGTGNVNVFMHYCCWPCVCDVQDFVKVDTITVTTRDQGPVKMHFAVIGDPCEHPEKLREPFVQPFDGRYTTLERYGTGKGRVTRWVDDTCAHLLVYKSGYYCLQKLSSHRPESIYFHRKGASWKNK